MEKLLEGVHKIIGGVAGEVCMSIVMKRVSGGRKTLIRWVAELRRAADLLDSKINTGD